MEYYLIMIGMLSILGFCYNYREKRQLAKRGKHYPTIAMALLGVVAPFGSLMGMLICGNRLKNTLLLLFVILMLAALIACTYLFRSTLNCL